MRCTFIGGCSFDSDPLLEAPTNSFPENNCRTKGDAHQARPIHNAQLITIPICVATTATAYNFQFWPSRENRNPSTQEGAQDQCNYWIKNLRKQLMPPLF